MTMTLPATETALQRHPVASLTDYHPLRRLMSRIMPTSGAAREIAVLDGVRALAIGLVLWTHIQHLAGDAGADVGSGLLYRIGAFGFTGVFLFFVLSGFLLFLPFARAIIGGGALPSARNFYLRRALRILPLYYTALAVYLLFLRPSLLHRANLHVAVLSVLLVHDSRPDSIIAITPPLWSLALEAQFYVLLPWL